MHANWGKPDPTAGAFAKARGVPAPESRPVSIPSRPSVFISYRRQVSWQLALLVRNDLIEHGFDTFMDVENLDSGEFARKILSQIEAREHFLVLLEPGSLDRIGEDDDWLRREIAYALEHVRNIVPVTANGFEFRRDLVLPPDVAKLPSFNAVAIQSEYFEAGMERLRTRFLKMPPNPTAPPPTQTRRAAGLARGAPGLSGKPTSAGTPVLPAPQLTRGHGPVGVQLSWSEVSGASEYVLERSEAPVSGGDSRRIRFREVYRGPDRSYWEFTPSTPLFGWWHYRVRADAYGQAGKWSDTLSVRTAFPTR